MATEHYDGGRWRPTQIAQIPRHGEMMGFGCGLLARVRRLSAPRNFPLLITAAMLAGHSAALSGCSSCKPPTTVEEAQSDLAREIQTKPLRFLVNRAPKEVKITPLPAGTDLESQGGWFFKVEIYSDEGIKKLYVATLGCSRLNVSIDTL